MKTLEIQLPRLHPGQAEIVEHSARFNVLSCGRRFGKTILGQDRAVHALLEAKKTPVAWATPEYKHLEDTWRLLVELLAPLTKAKDEGEHRIELINGSALDCFTLLNVESMRGRKYRRVILDEAALTANLDYAWNNVIRKLLWDLRGDAWIMSTPKGFNAFWRLWKLGQPGGHADWRSWKRPSSDNPHVPPEEIEADRLASTEAVWRQEGLGEFVEGAGGLFRHVTERAIATPQEYGYPGHAYVIGVDWAAVEDFCVFAVIDATTKELVYVERLRENDYVPQLNRLHALAYRFRPDQVIAEETGVGKGPVDFLKRSNLSVRSFKTTNASKKAAIDRLIEAFDREEIRILPHEAPNGGVVIDELMAYTAEVLPSAQLRYSAPEGMHDDCVMALAFAWSGAVGYPTSVLAPVTKDELLRLDREPGEPIERPRHWQNTGY